MVFYKSLFSAPCLLGEGSLGSRSQRNSDLGPLLVLRGARPHKNFLQTRLLFVFIFREKNICEMSAKIRMQIFKCLLLRWIFEYLLSLQISQFFHCDMLTTQE